MIDLTLERAAKMTIEKWRDVAENGWTLKICGFCVLRDGQKMFMACSEVCPLYAAIGKHCARHKFWRNWDAAVDRSDYARARYWATRIADALERLAVRKKWIAGRKGG